LFDRIESAAVGRFGRKQRASQKKRSRTRLHSDAIWCDSSSPPVDRSGYKTTITISRYPGNTQLPGCPSWVDFTRTVCTVSILASGGKGVSLSAENTRRQNRTDPLRQSLRLEGGRDYPDALAQSSGTHPIKSRRCGLTRLAVSLDKTEPHVRLIRIRFEDGFRSIASRRTAGSAQLIGASGSRGVPRASASRAPSPRRSLAQGRSRAGPAGRDREC
jgi:hypothetical protein